MLSHAFALAVAWSSQFELSSLLSSFSGSKNYLSRFDGHQHSDDIAGSGGHERHHARRPVSHHLLVRQTFRNLAVVRKEVALKIALFDPDKYPDLPGMIH